MTDENQLYNTVAPLANVVRLRALVDRIQNRPHGLPGMGTFYGPSGFGKSMAGVYVANKFQAVLVEVKSVWTIKKLCQAILKELGVPAASTGSEMLDQICEALAIANVPLLIDEADHLVKRKMIEIVRDIHDGSGAPVILIGEELLPQKLRVWERVHGRMLDWVPAQPGDIADVGHLARLYAREITVEADLQAKLLTASHGSIRRIVVNLERIREFAAIKGMKSVGLDAWGRQQFFTGDAPEIRRFGEVALGRRAG